MVEGRKLVIGSAALLAEQNVALPAIPGDERTLVHVADAGHLLGTFALEDALRPDAAREIAELKRLGLSVHLLTGDRRSVALRVALAAGIPEANVRAEVPPAGKKDAIAALKAQGAVVAMVGDGINDAHALAAADLGIAMASGTDVAMAASGITLIGGSLAGVRGAFALSHATLRAIRQNLGLAFAYNVVLIPVAAGVLYPAFGILMSPMLAGAAMAASSVSVVANALRLRH
jgi:Cu+-exporting ATPase